MLSFNHAALGGILELEDIPRGLGKTASVGGHGLARCEEQCLPEADKIKAGNT